MSDNSDFLSIPILFQYQASEHRFTPYVGLGFSCGYLIKEKVLLNGKVLDYQYKPNLNKLLFSTEVMAGVKYKLTRRSGIFVQPILRYGLNSINSNKQVKWIPYSYGLGAGINYRF